jgi:parallel beta helix pectate lyase-like protein
MNATRLMIKMFVVTIVCLLCNSLAQAQATRTWVSGVGDDANPCSRTAPCKTFAGAISKTAACGEISVLDPGGFGAVTITKSITINGDGTLAGILASLTNGVIVNAGVNDKVILRNISINGACNGLNGIRYLAGQMLRVENCTIYGFTGQGIDVVHSSASTPGELVVENTSITNVNNVAIRVDSTNVAPSAMINNVKINRTLIGLDVLKSSIATISNSVISHVTNQAVVAEQTATINAVGNVLFKNGTGISAFTSGSTIRFANSDIFNNTTGVNVAAGGNCVRFSNSRVFGNTTDFAPGVGSCGGQVNQ